MLAGGPTSARAGDPAPAQSATRHARVSLVCSAATCIGLRLHRPSTLRLGPPCTGRPVTSQTPHPGTPSKKINMIKCTHTRRTPHFTCAPARRQPPRAAQAQHRRPHGQGQEGQHPHQGGRAPCAPGQEAAHRRARARLWRRRARGAAVVTQRQRTAASPRFAVQARASVAPPVHADSTGSAAEQHMFLPTSASLLNPKNHNCKNASKWRGTGTVDVPGTATEEAGSLGRVRHVAWVCTQPTGIRAWRVLMVEFGRHF